MMLSCADIHRLVHPYIDGEFVEPDRVGFEHHIRECEPCRHTVIAEQSFKNTLRAKLSPPIPDNALRVRVATILDDIEEPTRPLLLAWGIPSVAVAAATAAIALFFLYPLHSNGSASVQAFVPYASQRIASSVSAVSTSDMFIDTVAADPIEVPVNQIRPESHRHVGITASAPPLPGAEPVRAWITNISHGKRALRVDYNITNARTGDPHQLHLFTFDPRGVSVRAQSRRRIGETNVLCTSSKGMNQAYYMKNGVGYALVSDLAQPDLLRLIEHIISAH